MRIQEPHPSTLRAASSGLVTVFLAACSILGVASSAAAVSYDAELVSADIFRNMATDGQYEMTVVYRNTGTLSWSEQDLVRLAVNPIPGLSGYRWGTTGRVLLSQTVAPGAEVTLTFDVVAPTTSGHHPFNVRMLKEGSFTFGDAFEDSVEVHDMSQAIVVDGEAFREGAQGRSWIPVGATIAPWHSSFSAACNSPSLPPGQKIWCEFELGNKTLAEANFDSTFADLARQGTNVVRSGFVGDLFETSRGVFETNYCDHFNWVLDKASEYGIRMIFSMSAPTRLQSLYNTEFCGAGSSSQVNCNGGNFPTTLKAVILDQEARDFTIERVWNFIGQCGLLDRPEILSYRLFDEPLIPSHTDRQREFLVQLWNDFVNEEFGSVSLALSSWGFTNLSLPHPPSTCGAAGNLLCPPTPNIFCVERLGGWGQFAKDYRKFFDTAYQEAYQEIVDALRNTADPACFPDCPCEATGCSDQDALMAVSFPSHIYYPTSGPNSPSAECEGVGAFSQDHGQWSDPGWSSEVFDYVALNVADWREAGTDWPILQLWVDYVRSEKPVVLHEFGRRADAPGGTTEQQDVTLNQTLNMVDRFGNGGQFHFYRDFEGFGGPAYGAKEKDGDPRPVFGEFPLIMDSLKTARDTVSESPIQLTIDPYSHVLLTNAILDALNDHQNASDDGVVRVVRDP